MLRNLSKVFMGVAIVFATTSAQAALIVTNASFEAPDLALGANQEVAVGNTIEDWTASNERAFYLEETANSVNAFDGDQYIQLNSNAGGGRISQLLGTTDAGPTSNITLSANFYERPSHAGGTYSLGLYSDAAGTIPLAEVTGQALVQSWDLNSVTALNVAGSTAVYAFISADSDATSRLFWVDDVQLSVVSVPEPGSMIFLGGGLLALVARRWH